MDELLTLKEAAINGDVEFLRNCIASNKPIGYYLTVFPPTCAIDPTDYGNILHIAAWRNREDFIKLAIESLPLEVIQQLLNQIDSEQHFAGNPLHNAAGNGNVDIVNMFLNVFKNSPSNDLQRPWLHMDNYGETPCHWAIDNNYEDCGLELLEMDLEFLSNVVNDGGSILIKALMRKSTKIAMKILRCSPSFCSKDVDGLTALHTISSLEEHEGQHICRLLLERDPKQIDKTGNSVLNFWANHGKLWPFKCLLTCNDIIPDIRKHIAANLISVAENKQDSNPLHSLAATTSSTNEEELVEIAKLLIDSYKEEKETQRSHKLSGKLCPWLVEDKQGQTPLDIAIHKGHAKLAIYIMFVDNSSLIKCRDNALILAIEKGHNEIAEVILDIVDKQGWTQLLTNHQQLNALHLAPKCNQNLCKRLLKNHPQLLKGVDKQGSTILHMWVRIGEIWPFQLILHNGEIDNMWRSYCIKLINVGDYHMETPIHVAANTIQEAKDEIAKLLIQAFKFEFLKGQVSKLEWLPWFSPTKSQDAVLHIAIRNKRQNLALYILTLCDDNVEKLLDLYPPPHNILFLAMENNCYQVAKEILTKLSEESWTTYATDSCNNRNVLHLSPTCTDKTFGMWLVDKASKFISKQDHNGNTPLDEASSVGSDWIIKGMLEKDSSALNNAPSSWIKACEKSHVSAIRAFIDYNPGKFRDHCIKHKDSPLHHIQLTSLTDYEEFINLPRVKDLINIQNAQHLTPLHISIRKEDIFLTETLLNMDKISYNIKDSENVTAMDLLAKKCDDNQEWDEMCKRIGFDPRIKTTYFQHHTNLLDVRNTLSVVAALLATIALTAGFTLPGGFDQSTGEAILAKKLAFLVFLIFDTLALFFSILVLVCLIWSMVYDPSRSLLLIDRSMVLLMRALYCTLVAFMTGVYVVISPKTLWVAIFILIVVCTLLGISVSKSLLCKVIGSLIPAANKDLIDPIQQLELGKLFSCVQDKNSLQEIVPLTMENSTAYL